MLVDKERYSRNYAKMDYWNEIKKISDYRTPEKIEIGRLFSELQYPINFLIKYKSSENTVRYKEYRIRHILYIHLNENFYIIEIKICEETIFKFQLYLLRSKYTIENLYKFLDYFYEGIDMRY